MTTLILGTGGFAIELCALLRAAGRTVAGFVGPEGADDLPAPYLGGDAALDRIEPDADILIAVGAPDVRERLSNMIRSKGRRFATFISPAAFVAGDAVIGEGVIIYPNATVHARVRLEPGILINSNASIGHETQIGAFTNVGPGVSVGGRCHIGTAVYLGIGCSVLEQLTIAPKTVIGAGAVVVRDIESAGTYAGVPARLL